MENIIYEATSGNLSAQLPDTFMDPRAVVAEINRLAIKTLEKGAMEIGEYVLDAIFKGSLDEALSRNPYKHQTLQEVCDNPNLLIDRRRLGMWVRAAHLRRVLTANQVPCSSLTCSHFAALLRVTDDKRCRELAREADKNRWSVRNLIDKIDEGKPGSASNGKARELMRAVGHPLALLEDSEMLGLLEDREALEQQLKSADRLHIAKIIDDIVAKMSASTDHLKRARRNIAIIELGDVRPEEAL